MSVREFKGFAGEERVEALSGGAKGQDFGILSDGMKGTVLICSNGQGVLVPPEVLPWLVARLAAQLKPTKTERSVPCVATLTAWEIGTSRASLQWETGAGVMLAGEVDMVGGVWEAYPLGGRVHADGGKVTGTVQEAMALVDARLLRNDVQIKLAASPPPRSVPFVAKLTEWRRRGDQAFLDWETPAAVTIAGDVDMRTKTWQAYPLGGHEPEDCGPVTGTIEEAMALVEARLLRRRD